MNDPAEIPLWVKLVYTAFIAVWAPIYARHRGWANFMWFSDIGLIGTMIGLWLESALIISTMALAAIAGDLGWDAIAAWRGVRRLVRGRGSGAVFINDAAVPRYVRLFSLFHIFLPLVLLWAVWVLGYDARALPVMIFFGWGVLIATYLWTNPRENINCVFGVPPPPKFVTPRTWLMVVMIDYLFIMWWPTHAALQWWTSGTIARPASIVENFTN